MKKFIPLLLVVFFASCDKDLVYKDTINEFPLNRWTSGQPETFSFSLQEDVPAADINIFFSHVYDPQYTTVPLSVTISGPVNKTFFTDLQLTDGSGKPLSDCAGDICDFEVAVKKGINLPKGDYKISVQNKYNFPYLPNSLALGIRIKKAE